MESYTVENSDMISRKRADERFYNPRDIKTILQIAFANVTYYKFSALISKDMIKTGKGIPKSEQGFGDVNYLKVSNINEYFIRYDQPEVVSEEIVKKHKMPLLQTNDLLMSRVGTVGNVAIFQSDDPKSTYSDNVIRIRLLKSRRIDPFYVVIFLNSEYGRAQIRRFAKQSLQEVINQTSIRNLIIPLPELEIQYKISRAVLGHFRNIKKYQKLIDEEKKKIASAIRNALFSEMDEQSEDTKHSQLLTLLDKLNKNAEKNVSDFREEKILGDFV